jgi:N-acetylglucosaminyldiphosphoundecaprenol N-acetyl-beta-D-mannosaminyltransferase
MFSPHFGRPSKTSIGAARQQTIHFRSYSIERFSSARRHGCRRDMSISNGSFRLGEFPMSDTALHPPPEVIAPFDRSERTTSRRSSRILNGRFDRLSADQVVEELIQTIHAGQRGTLCTVNVAILMMMRSDARLQRFVDSARWTVADGQPLIWASHLTPHPLPERITGIDLIDQLCARAARDGIGVYFLGASNKIVRATAHLLRARHPGLDVRGCADGYFGAGEAAARARAVAASGAELLFVAMGVPRQESFIEEQWEHLGARVVIGVGGSFDVTAGLRKRAPVFIQRAGLEWAYRVAQEPRRLFKRYLITNSQFVGLMSWSAITAALHSRRNSWRTIRRV